MVPGSSPWKHQELRVHVLVLGPLEHSEVQSWSWRAHGVGQEAELKHTNKSGEHLPSYTAAAVGEHQVTDHRVSANLVLSSSPCR